MADPWPSGQWLDPQFRHHRTNQMYHQLALADTVDDSEQTGMPQLLPPYYREEVGLGVMSASMAPTSTMDPSKSPVFGANIDPHWPFSQLAAPYTSNKSLQPSQPSPAFRTDRDYFWPEPSDPSQPTASRSAPGTSSQLLQPSQSLPAFQAREDYIWPVPSQPTTSGSAHPAQLFPLASSVQCQMPGKSSDFQYQASPGCLELLRPSQSSSCIRPVPSQPTALSSVHPAQLFPLAPSVQYQMSGRSSDFQHQASPGCLEPLRPSQSSFSIPHAQPQHQLSLGFSDSTAPLSSEDDVRQRLRRTRNKLPSSKPQTSHNVAPRNVPRARKAKPAEPIQYIIVSEVLLLAVQAKAKLNMLSSIFAYGFFPTEDELTDWAESALDVAVTGSGEDIRSWRSKGAGNEIAKLKNAVKALYRDFAEQFGHLAIMAFQLSFHLAETQKEIEFLRQKAVVKMLESDSFLSGDLRVEVKENDFQTVHVPLAHPAVISFLEEMVSDRGGKQYHRYMSFHVENGPWENCIRNTACFIAALCRSKLRQAVGIPVDAFPSKDDRKWYAESIVGYASFTGYEQCLLRYFVRAMRRRLGL